MTILDGQALYQKTLANLRPQVASLKKRGIIPTLAIINIGDHTSSSIYIRNKQRACQEIGIVTQLIQLPESISEQDLLKNIDQVNSSSAQGLIVQLPLPKHISKQLVVNSIDPAKDIDGFHPYNLGRMFTRDPHAILPATPLAVLMLLDEYQIDLTSQKVVIVNASDLIGKPLAMLLVDRGATVTICHKLTKHLPEHTSTADILISATSHKHLITADMVKDGVIGIDIGFTHEDGHIYGDFDQLQEKASFLTPVPGGVGIMTVAALLTNLVQAC